MADKQAPGQPTHSTGNPTVSNKISKKSDYQYIGEVLKQYEKENDNSYDQALQEYKDLLAAKDLLYASGFGHLHISKPVYSFKEEKVREEERTYKPNLAKILLDACKLREKNSSLAWIEYVGCIEKHKTAQEVMRHNSQLSDGQGEGEKTTEITQDIKGSDFVDSQNGNLQKQKSTPPPSKLSSVNDKERSQAPLLYAVIADVSKKVPSYKRWKEAVSEFIILTTLSQSEPKSSQKKRSNSQSGYQNKSKQPAKSYNNSIEKLLDQDWGPDRALGPSVLNDYRHLFTCESVLKSTFPEADIFGLVDSTIRGPEDVPPELRHKALFHFLLSFNRKKYGVEPSDAWRDFGRLVLAEKQLKLAKKAQGGPDLHQNIIVNKQDFYKMQNELKEKTEEVEELSTRLSKYENKQLTEGNPNIADLSDTHRPTRLGEMYSQLFDDEWSEAFEAFKPKTEDEDDDIFPDTLYILQDLFRNMFEFCKDHSKCQKIYLEESFANAIALKTLKENFNRTPNEKSQRSVTVESKMNETTNSSNKNHELGTEDNIANSSVYEKTIASLNRDFRRAASSASVKNITELYINTELPNLIPDNTFRADVRVLTYVRKCVELCWYMCMQDPPMVIVLPKQGQLVDKTLFSFHGRRGKIVEVCVWPALLLHDNGPLVCKGYVLPEERNRNR